MAMKGRASLEAIYSGEEWLEWEIHRFNVGGAEVEAR